MKAKYTILAVMLLVLAAVVSAGSVSKVDVGDSSTFDATVSDSFVNQEPDPVQPGNYVELRWRIQNMGVEAIDDIWFELLPEYPFTLDSGVSAVQKMGKLSGFQTGNDGIILYYKVRVNPRAIEGENNIGLRYTADGGNIWVELDNYKVRVQTTDSVLSISDVKTTPSIVKPGAETDLTITLTNLADSVLRDVEVELNFITVYSTTTATTVSELPFSPVGSTNQRTIKIIDPGKSVDVPFKLVADADAEAKVYKVILDLNYSDSIGNSHTRQNIISLVVGGAPDLETTLDSSEIISSGSAGNVRVRFVNKDALDVKFLNVKLGESKAYTILSSDSVYIGNIDSDDYDTAEFNLYIDSTEKESITLPISFEYKDANGKEYSDTKEITLRMFSKQNAVKMGLQSKSNSFGVLVVLIIVVAGFIFYRRWKKRKAKKQNV